MFGQTQCSRSTFVEPVGVSRRSRDRHHVPPDLTPSSGLDILCLFPCRPARGGAFPEYLVNPSGPKGRGYFRSHTWRRRVFSTSRRVGRIQVVFGTYNVCFVVYILLRPLFSVIDPGVLASSLYRRRGTQKKIGTVGSEPRLPWSLDLRGCPYLVFRGSFQTRQTCF